VQGVLADHQLAQGIYGRLQGTGQWSAEKRQANPFDALVCAELYGNKFACFVARRKTHDEGIVGRGA
jgi:hypothetical protein